MTNVPAYLLNRQVPAAATEDLLGGLTTSLPPHLSISDNRFVLVDAAGNTKPIPTFHLDICIIGSNPATSRVFYDPNAKYDPKGENNTPPLCFSDNGVGPSRQSSSPQAPTCAVCPNAEWGSAISQMTGRGIPACQTGKKLAFIVPGDDSNLVYMLKVPPASLKNLAKYVKTLGGHTLGGRPVAPPDAITRLEFESQGVLKFTPVGFVDEDTYNRTELAYGTNIIAEITGREDVAIDPNRQLGRPAQAQQALPAGQPAPAMQPPPLPTAAMPTAGFGQQAPAPGFGAAPQGSFGQAPVPQGGFGQQTPPAQEKPKRGKPKKDEAPAIPADDMAIPGFLRRTEQPATPVPPAPSFGMVENAPAPDGGVNEALAKAFQLPGV